MVGIFLFAFAEEKEFTPDENTLLLLHFNEGGGLPKDSSSFENRVVANYGTWTEGIAGYGLRFTHKYPYKGVEIEDSKVLRVPTKELTVECWVKIDEIRETSNIISRPLSMKAPKGYVKSFSLIHNKNGKFGFEITTDKGQKRVYTESSYWKGEWHHIAGVYDGKELKIYVDGKDDTKKVNHLQSGYVLYISGIPTIIGGCVPGVASFEGVIDEVRISNCVRYR